jgi:hypothetical protein
MKKYYVSGNDSQHIILAHTEVQAALLVLKKVLLKETDGYCDMVNLPNELRISQRGFDEHSDDEIYDLELLMNLIRLNAEFEGVV